MSIVCLNMPQVFPVDRKVRTRLVELTIDFMWVEGGLWVDGVVCKVIFMSTPTTVEVDIVLQLRFYVPVDENNPYSLLMTL